MNSALGIDGADFDETFDAPGKGLFTSAKKKKEEAIPFAELAVLTRPADIRNRSVGHVLVAISIAGKGEEAWGLYEFGLVDEIVAAEPEEGIKTYSFGEYTRSVVVPISEKQYNQFLAVKKEYNQDYNRFWNNCIDFVQEVLAAVGQKPVSRTLFPDSFGRNLEKQLGVGGVRCLGAPNRLP